jgi:glycosyltransferase involved in cell wall biosynthesis
VKRVFLNIFSVHGHRRIYCREFCEYFLSRDLSVTVATDLAALEEYPQLQTLREHPRIRFVPDDWTCEARASKQLRRLKSAAREADADLVFLAEADAAHHLLLAQLVRPLHRLPGRRVGLFLRSTNYVHEPKRPRAWRFGRDVERPFLALYQSFSPARPRVFHGLFMRRFGILDAALCLDEVFVAKRGAPYSWLPDIGVPSSEEQKCSDEATAWGAQLSDFLATQGDRPVVVYVGDLQPRRGYETLLQLAYDADGCFVHCGKPRDLWGYPSEPLELQNTLTLRRALLQSGRPYEDFETAQTTLRAARCVVLPYHQHLGSSGVMLQALMAGRPLLVPDQGLMAWRVRNFDLGLTFVPGDWRDMRNKFSILSNTPPETFRPAIDRFLEFFTKSNFEVAMDFALGLSAVRPSIPSLVAGRPPTSS